MRKIELLDSFEAWYSTNVEAMGERGVNLTFGRTDDDRHKHAAWLGAEHGSKLAELILWDCGEAELVAGSEGNPEINEHHDINDADGLESLLSRLVQYID